ncbi:DsrE family protein [Thiomicrorhabdus indica]|uniref:DsrE family protein n=1 Tax=Thiomicrorhabdus indica TaxID=2267253 RepID=UPI00102DE34E|nr:DsrE family protein [Thiomicrorhabdus indica]
MKHFAHTITLLTTACLLMASAFQTVQAKSERYAEQKVVYHINYDDPSKQSSTLRNIQNHVNALGADHVNIKVILHGNGLSLLLKPEALANVPKFKTGNADTSLQQKIDSLRMQGVQFNVCSNTVKGRNVNIDRDLYEVEKNDVVPSGVAELTYLQQKGYLYLRP